MSFTERLYIPRFRVVRKEANIPREKVAEVIVAEYATKGVAAGNPQRPIEVAEIIGLLDNKDVSMLLIDPKIRWHLEEWPINHLRMTQMQPPESDVFNLHQLVAASRKRFRKFAEAVRLTPETIVNDQGFHVQPERDKLPILGIRGILHNHILDGHHRTTLAVWEGKTSMQTLTAYSR